MIVMHESEYLVSPLSDEALRLIALFVDRETYDKLLYRGRAYVGINHTNSRIPMAVRSYADSVRDGAIRATQDKGVQAQDEAVYAVFVP